LDIKEIIHLLKSLINNPSAGLPEDLFLFISEITPLVNIDLLIQNERRQTLLTWRDDEYYGPGWHVPGGIVRFKETLSHRINTVAQKELGAKIAFNDIPLAINETIHPTRKARGHFISLLYKCTLLSPLDDKSRYTRDTPKPGQWAWHDKCPDNIISIHEIYRTFM